jgi:hypothetical protein
MAIVKRASSQSHKDRASASRRVAAQKIAIARTMARWRGVSGSGGSVKSNAAYERVYV